MAVWQDFENVATEPNKLAVIYSKRGQKAGFIHHTKEGKGEEKQREHGKRKEAKEKSNGCTLSFYIGYFGDGDEKGLFWQ